MQHPVLTLVTIALYDTSPGAMLCQHERSNVWESLIGIGVWKERGREKEEEGGRGGDGTAMFVVQCTSALAQFMIWFQSY